MGQAWSNVTYNIIKNSMRTASNPRGIELGTAAGVYTGLDSVCNITGNRIFNIGSNLAGGAYGVFVNFGTDSSNMARAITIANNMIYGISSLGTNSTTTANFPLNPFGVYIAAPANIIRFNGNTDIGVNLYYNSINLAQSSPMTTSGSVSAALGVSPSIIGGISSLNNVFQNRMGGTVASNAYAVAVGGSFNPFKISDYNNYFTAAPTPTTNDRMASGVATATRTAYNEWYELMSFTKQDTSSMAFITPFTSDNNLFIPNGTTSVIHGSAKPILTVTGDALGTARNFATPTIGAHEFDNGNYIDSIAPRIFNVTDATSCFAFGVSLSFRIYDRLSAGDTLYYKLNGGPVTPLQAAVSNGTLRTYAFPPIPGSSLLEYRVVGRDFKNPPNIGYLPMFKTWDTLNISITNFPYTNSFEGLNNPIWTIQTTAGNATWELGAFGSISNPPLGANTGIKAAMFRASNFAAGSSARMVSPCLDFTNLKSPTLRFRVSQNSDNPTKNDSVQVSVTFGGGFFTAALKSARRLPDVTGTFNFPGWDVREVCLSEFAGLPGLRIGIEGFAAGGGQNLLIDDIEIFDDVQNQAFSPKVFAQCFRDSIFITVPNSDSRFAYTAYNAETGNPVTLRYGNGGNLNIGILAPAVDTFRTFVYARNTFSVANGTGFNASQVSCGNYMNDTVTVLVNRFYNGPFVVAGTPFSGSYNAGDNNNPDGFKVGDTITYKFVPPAFYTNADYGTKWEVNSITAANVTASPNKNFTGFSVVNPTSFSDGYIRVYANASQMDTTIQFTIKYRLLDSYCDSVMYRSFHVATPPTADFNVSPTGNKCALSKLFFTAEPSTRPQINFPFNFSWQFGDNTASVGLNPEKVYTTPGTYTVRLFLTDRYGLVSIKEQQITILPAPSAEFTSATPCANDSTLFSAGTQPAGSNFAWTFPGNKSDSREQARFSFAKFDTTYTVNLTVTNSSGCSHTVSKQYYVFARPTANFSSTPHCFSSAVPLSNSSTIQSGSLGFTWDWGNGQTGLGATPNYKFPSTGTFSVTMKAISNFGCVDSVVKAVTVNDRPFAGFNVANACKDQIINLTNTTTFSGGAQNVEYAWDFGDNSFSSEATPANKIYTATATRTVSLRTIDKLNGCRDSVRKDITINYTPVPVFTATPSPEVCVNNEVKLFNNSYTFDGDQFTCAWDFGDGNTAVACAPGGYIYTTQGNYTMKLTIKTVNGACSDSKTQSMIVSGAPVLSVDTQYVDKQLFPYCDYSSKLKFKTNIAGAVSYAWKFGDKDSSKSSQPEPTFTYNDRGVFNASVTIEDVSGCIVTKTFAVRVECKVGVQEELAAKFNLSAYPNPFGSSTNVHFETMQSENVKISVIDMLGRVVKSSDLGKIVGGAHDLNLDESFFGSAGSYLVKVEIGDVSIYKPLIKQ
jgi:PKD repeat protein